MIGMFTFETLEHAIKRAKNSAEPSDARELTDMVMKLTQSNADLDEVRKVTEREILGLLIARELKSANEPSFANVCHDAQNWNFELAGDEVLSNLTQTSKKAVIESVRTRLEEFSGALTILRHKAKKSD